MNQQTLMSFMTDTQAVLSEENMLGMLDRLALNENALHYYAGLYAMTKPEDRKTMLRDGFIKPYKLLIDGLDGIKASGLGPSNQARAVQSLFEEYCKSPTIEEHDKTPPITCRGSGCNHCCYILANIQSQEAALMVEVSMERGIELDKELLRKQFYIKKTPLDWIAAGPELAKCVFLIDGKCSVYDVRPLTCRVHVSTESPDLCNPFRNWRGPVAYANSGKKQLFMSAVGSVFGFPDSLSTLVKNAMKEAGIYG